MKVRTNDGISLHKLQKKNKEFLNIKNLVKYQKRKTPFFTIVMLAWNRTDSLIEVLKDLLKHDVPMNLCLTIQECLTIPREKRSEIQELIDKFYKSDVVWHSENRGTGLPRKETLERALKTFKSTPYILTTDDDMYFPKYSFYALASLLDEKPEHGVVSLWCSPAYSKIKFKGDPADKYLKVDGLFTNGFHDVTCLGSATAMWRREVFDTVMYDSNYYIGWADFDLGMQLHSKGWKAGVLAIKALKALNDKDKVNHRGYNQVRHNSKPAMNGKQYFKKKWGFLWRG